MRLEEPGGRQVLDWMKAVGMCLIVYGHVAAATTIPLTPPVYLKQFGVAFFLFATAFTLARDTRPATLVLFNRLFRVYLFGAALALLITVGTSWTTGGLALSNYLPFLAGANVLFDNFPVNPTTWYVGTFLHFLILWAVALRHLRVRAWMVIVALLAEIPIRMLLITIGGRFVAYMFLTNWMAVFLLGLYRGAARDTAPPKSSAWPVAAVLIGGLYAYGLAAGRAGFTPTFPFMTLERSGSWGLVLVSIAVSALYFGVTALMFEAARRVSAPAPIRFIARNSLIIFLAHMPIVLLLHPWLVSLGLGYWTRVVIQLIVALPILGGASEILSFVLQPDRLRDWVWRSANAQKIGRVSPHPGRVSDSVGL